MRRSPGYQLPLQLHLEVRDPERRGRLRIEFEVAREERARWAALCHPQSRLVVRADDRVRRLAGLLIGAGL